MVTREPLNDGPLKKEKRSNRKQKKICRKIPGTIFQKLSAVQGPSPTNLKIQNKPSAGTGPEVGNAGPGLGTGRTAMKT